MINDVTQSNLHRPGRKTFRVDVTLEQVTLPVELRRAFGGPRHGLPGLRERVGAPARALTCSVLKPQGLGPEPEDDAPEGNDDKES